MQRRFLASCTIALTICASQALAVSVQVAFWSDGRLTVVSRQVESGKPAATAAVEALLAGPAEQEQQQGISSAFHPGTTLNKLVLDGTTATLDLSAEVLPGLDESRLEALYRQAMLTLQLAGVEQSVKLTVAGAYLSDYLSPAPQVLPRSAAQAAPQPAAANTMNSAPGSALAGKLVSLSPGHGRFWSGSAWVWDRPQNCPPLSREDLHNVDLTIYLRNFLEQDGAQTKAYRCLDKSYGISDYDGQQWWRMSAAYWLKHLGYPCSVYASYTGDCDLGTGASETSDSTRSRPLASDYDNTDVHLSIHTNALSGDCFGSSCPNGTITFYDSSSEHAAWGDISKTLATKINNAMCTAIKSHYDEPDWYNRGAANANGGFAEARIPKRAAVLIEVAFHDSCDRDALYLQDEYFRSTTMYGVYKGVCQYFDTTPTWAFNASQYVRDTIPSRMLPGRSYTVSVTYTNRSVLWVPDRGYRLGAVGGADPFTSETRIGFTGKVDTGQDRTFTFTMTAPTTPGTHTTSWRMVRDRVDGTSQWFGPTHTEEVVVAWPDFDGDGDIDSVDFGHFQACYSGEDTPQLDESCQNAKLDGDEDVDLDDFNLFKACASGPGVPIDPACAL